MRQLQPSFFKKYRIFYASAVLMLSSLFTINQICYQAFIAINSQIEAYLKQIGYQLNEPDLVHKINLPIKSITTWYQPIYWIVGFLLVLLVLVSVQLNERSTKEERTFTACFMKNIFAPICIASFSVLLFFLTFQTHIEVAVTHLQLSSINHVMGSKFTLFDQLHEATTNHFTVKLPTTYEGLIQMNKLTSHQWTLIIINIIVKNIFLFISITLVIYGFIYYMKSRKKSNYSSVSMQKGV